ncbi:MAG: DNA polymerase/3'-5' exonuclease PolX [Anaerolineae bacterium]
MSADNEEIARILNEIGDVLEIQGANVYRVRAYRNASRYVLDMGQSVAAMLMEGKDLSALPGIGHDLAIKIEEIVRTGKLGYLEELEQETPPSLVALLRIGGLGPKKVKALHDQLGILTVEDLRRAAQAGKVQQLPGFGPRTEQGILRELDRKAEADLRIRLDAAESVVQSLVAYLREGPGVRQVEVAGSFRRRRDTIGDLDILMISDQGAESTAHFAGYSGVLRVPAQGETRATVLLKSGLQVDLRVVPAESYGAALFYFTGSRAHNLALRNIAVRRGIKINEYGIYRGEQRLAGATEEEIYHVFGMVYIPPELREDRGEIRAAMEGRLPTLIRQEDMRGDLQAHTRETDGRATIEEMARAAKARGYEYLAITDHSKQLTVARGMDAERLAAQIDEIDRLNEEMEGFRVLKGIEVDILEDGTLDLPDEILARLDVCVGAIHSRFTLSEQKQTERLIRAMDNPHLHIIAHPTGRLIGRRPPYAVDMEQVLRAALARGCFLEINAQPERLDLNDVDAKLARDLGVKLSISTDAHTVQELNLMPYGIAQARRGWLTREDALNTRPWEELAKLFDR